MFGGSCADGLLGDTWLYDIRAARWTQVRRWRLGTNSGGAIDRHVERTRFFCAPSHAPACRFSGSPSKHTR